LNEGINWKEHKFNVRFVIGIYYRAGTIAFRKFVKSETQKQPNCYDYASSTEMTGFESKLFLSLLVDL